MVIQKNVSENGKSTSWHVPSWIVSVCTGLSILWVSTMSASMVFCVSELSQGGRNTKAEGMTRDLRIEMLEKFDADLEIPPKRFEQKVDSLIIDVEKNSTMIINNHNLISEALYEIRAMGTLRLK